MIRSQAGVLRQVDRLFRNGTVASLSDGQLLERFLNERDEVAFEALVDRHGKMVLALCRRLLRNEKDVEESFQDAFLMLVRKARSIREPDLLGGWLYRVSYRIAVRSRSRASLRRAAERFRALDPEQAAEQQECTGWALHEELNRLPEKHRLPIVLCYLQGLSHDEAARRLRWPVGTVRGRLARARAQLKSRLEGRGFALAIGLLAPVDAAPGVDLVAQTAATAIAACRVGAGSFPLFLNRSIIMGLPVRLKVAACLVAGFSLFTWGALGVSGKPPSEAAAVASATEAAAPEASASNVDAELERAVEGKIARAVPVTKDCMVLSYLPEWDHGEVDNIGVANNNGGVELLIDWDRLAAADVAPPGRKFILALYSRKTTAGGPAGQISAYEINAPWKERTAWQNKPQVAGNAAAHFDFGPGDGWKLFDLTPLIRSTQGKGQGVLFRFEKEDLGEDWSGYAFVSREGQMEFESRRPVLLLVDPK